MRISSFCLSQLLEAFPRSLPTVPYMSGPATGCPILHGPPSLSDAPRTESLLVMIHVIRRGPPDPAKQSSQLKICNCTTIYHGPHDTTHPQIPEMWPWADLGGQLFTSGEFIPLCSSLTFCYIYWYVYSR